MNSEAEVNLVTSTIRRKLEVKKSRPRRTEKISFGARRRALDSAA